MRISFVGLGVLSMACVGIADGPERATGTASLDGGQAARADAGPAGDAGAPFDAGPRSCENLTGSAAEIQIINRFLDRTLTVTWTDEACQPVLIASLEPQTATFQTTLGGDAWQVRDQVSGEVLFDGRASQGVTTLIFPTNDAQVCSAVTTQPVTTTFRNRYTDRALTLSWVDFACKEHPMGTIAARAALTINSYLGHVFRFRRQDTGELVKNVDPLTSTTLLVAVPESGPVCSDAGNQLVQVTFVNNYPTKTVKLMWVDYQCNEVSMGDIAPGGSLVLNSYVTHVFRFRDSATQTELASPLPIAPTTTTISVP